MFVTAIRRGLVLGASLGTLALTGSASAAVLRGVVVSHNSRAHSFVVAERKGHLVSVHSHRSPALGRVVVVRAHQLRNGTYAAHHITVRHQSKRRVRIHGVVTFVSRRRHEFAVSAGGASLMVHASRLANHVAAASTGSGMPAVGDDVTVETQIDDQGDLEDQGVQDHGAQTQNVEVEGTVLSIDTTANTLTISADGEDDTTQSITVEVPSTIDITQFSVGQEVKLTVSLQSDGSFLLQGSSEDGNSDQADNSGDEQGCQGDGPDSASTTCGNSGSDGGGSQGGDGSSGRSGGDTSGGHSGSGSSSSGSTERGAGSGGSQD
jgi:hypothetical protein